jgi:AcrR family transcriptional regulator
MNVHELRMKSPNTKQQILSAALDFFSQHGYSGASIRQIAREVGVRESAIYNHYKSKEDIFGAILAEFNSKKISQTVLSDDLLDDLSEPEIFLTNFAKRLIENWNSPNERKFIRVLLMEQFTLIGKKELSTTGYLNELRTICKLIFEEMIKINIIKNFDPSILADEFTGLLFLIRAEHMSCENTKDMKTVYNLLDQHVSFFWGAVKI